MLLLRRLPLVLPSRFALWTLQSHDGEGCDRKLLASLPSPPLARLLLPAKGPNVAPFAYAAGANAWSAKELRADDSFFALSVLPNTSNHDAKIRTVRSKYEEETEGPSAAIATRLLLANDLVNVWDFSVAPQHACELHEHLLPYVFINRSSGVTCNLDAQLRETGETEFKAGDARFVDVDPSQQRCIHAFRNVGVQPLEQYVVEFKA